MEPTGAAQAAITSPGAANYLDDPDSNIFSALRVRLLDTYGGPDVSGSIFLYALVLVVEHVALLALRVWMIAVRQRMRRRCKGKGTDNGECNGLHFFLHCEPSVRLFDVNFDLHFACTPEGKDERKVLVDIEGFSESQQEKVRSIWI